MCSMLDESARPRTADGLDVNEAEDGLVVYVPANDTVHHLNKTAGVIFGLCDGTRTSAAIAAEVAALFRLDAPPFEETATCLSGLAANGLIV
jgi:Coenzyme PQQ synthesis protein D (PqqD)